MHKSPYIRLFLALLVSLAAARYLRLIDREQPIPHVQEVSDFAENAQPGLPEPIPSPAKPAARSREHRVEEREIIAFKDWLAQYHSAPLKERLSMLPAGMKTAAERRAVLAKLIRTEPERALAAAVPMMVRRELPQELLALIEDRVSGVGDFALLAAMPARGNRVAEPVYLSASVNGREYRAFTFGLRERVRNLNEVGIHGIALDGAIAVSDSPIRVLESGETADGKPVEIICEKSRLASLIEDGTPLNLTGPIAFDAGDKICVECQPSHVAEFAARLAAKELAYNAADGGSGTSGVASRPAQAWTHGAKKVLLIRVDFSDRTGTPVNPTDSQPITETYVVNVFNVAGGVRDFYEQNSFGKTTISVGPAVAGDSPDVTSVLRMPATAASYATAGNNTGLHNDARTLAMNAGFNLANYDRIGVVFADLGGIAGSQITYAGLGNINGANFWINGHFSFTVVAHELGHTYGLLHANLWQVSDGNPVSPAGTSVEYGDEFDIMGDGSSIDHHFSQWNKSILQWIPDSAVTTITTSGTYRVFRFDAQGANLANPLALKIVRNGTQDYWIGHRRATSNAALDNGASILWGYNQLLEGDLLDMATPGTSIADSALQVGASFNDSVAGIALTTTARGGSGNDEWIDVQVTLQPRIQFASAAVVVNEQAGSVTLTVNRANSGTGAVSVNFATSAGSATSPADFTSTSGTLSWANGDLAPKTITVPIVPDANVESPENFAVTLSGITGGILNGTVSTVTIVDPGASDPQFAPDFINSTVEKVLVLPDGGILIAGWFSSLQDAAFTSYTRRGIARFNADGTVDPSFAIGGGVTAASNARVLAIARQPDGKIIIGGNFTTVDGAARANIARVNADGSNDATFNPGTGANDIVSAVLLQPDGKIVIGGFFTTINGGVRRLLARLNADGSVDSSFTPPTFGAGTGWRVESLARQPDGNIIVGGSFFFSGSPSKASLCRVLGTTGALDASFNGVTNGAHVAGNTGSIRSVTDIIILGDGKLIISGDFTAFNNTARGGIAKLTSIGGLDAAFAPTSNGSVNALRLQPDGKIIIGGAFTTFNGATANHFARINAAGANDAGFIASGGLDGTVKDFALQPDGRVVLGGDHGHFQGSADTSPLWRFYAGLPALPGTVQLSAVTNTGVEGTSLTISATRTGGTAGAISIGYSTVSGSASAADFTAAGGNFSWADGDGSPKNITIPIAADALADSGETFALNLGEPLIGTTILGGAQQTSVTIFTAFGAWQAANFTTVELTDTNISGDHADPDGDGRNNLMEFALGLAPKTPDASGSPTAGVVNISGSNYLTLTFRRRTPSLDLSYAPKSTIALPGTWTADTVPVGSPAANGDGTETVTVRSPAAITPGSKRFMRIEISRTP